ncbi:nucleotidyltransferase family protein [Aquimarina amphilecti]|uniref:nucleotidyltransferase family protein n=1 Tax=Aquimarina amphilecti TaxID=1038014 RepID=UPI00244E6878|nr:nucleotidyltransferase family protein [Aquimarina amphilecti]
MLAAGSSSRMGTPKQLLPWKKDCLIIHEVKKSLELNLSETYVVLGANFELIQKEIIHFPVHVLNNKDWGLGMGSSITFGVRHLINNQIDFDAILITLVDQPLIDVSHLSCLISKFNSNQDKIIATGMKNKIGVPALFPKAHYQELLELKEDFGARYIIKKYEDDLLVIDGGNRTDDIDTIEQYNALLEREKE